MKQKISVIILTYNREESLRKVIENILEQSYKDIEIIIIDNDTSKKLKLNYPKTKYFHQKQNLGVPAGRTYGASKAIGDIFVFLDDDAFFVGKDNFQTILKKFEDPTIGALVFKIKNFYADKIIKAEFPHKDLSKQDEEFLVSRFIGAGHALTRKAFGLGYDFNLKKFWFEELDLSYKIINDGYKILYTPEIKIIHKQSPSGRLPNKEKFYAMVYNKIYITTKYLPLFYLFIHSRLWKYKLFKEAKKNDMCNIFFEAYEQAAKDAVKTREYIIGKTILNKQAIKYLKQTKGRLWY